jgi:hypothetical protein
MIRSLNQSADKSLIRSAEHEKPFHRVVTQTPPAADTGSAPNRAHHTRITHRDLQALWACGLPLLDGPGHGPKRYLSTVARTGERPRLGYVPNAAYPQVAEFLANYRKLQEMLNEICAINAELLRRRESLN